MLLTSYIREVALWRGGIFRVIYFIVFKNNNKVKINKITTLPCYTFILLLFPEEKYSKVKDTLKWSSTEQIWGFYGAFYHFSSFTTHYFIIFFLHLTWVLISFPYLPCQLKTSLLWKPLLSKIVLNLPDNVTYNFIKLIPNVHNWAKIKLTFMNTSFCFFTSCFFWVITAINQL